MLFRFCVAYFGVYVFFTQMLGGMTLANVRLQLAWPMKNLVLGAAKSVFHIDRELVLFSGSGDKIYDWVQAFIMAVRKPSLTARTRIRSVLISSRVRPGGTNVPM